MSDGKVGQAVHSEFALYEADGVTTRSGAAGDVSVLVLKDGAVDASVVTISEVAGAPGQYVAELTPAASGKFTLVMRDTVFNRDLVESFDVTQSTIDDVAFAVANLAAHDALAALEGVDAVRTATAWSPTVVILRRATMTPIDPDMDVDLVTPLLSLEILSADGATVLQIIPGSELVRSSLGKYAAVPTPLVSVGTYFIRVSFIVGGVELTDVVRFSVSPAAGTSGGVVGSAVTLTRVYTYPTSLANARYDLTGLPPEEIWRMIGDVSAELETLTRGNIFNAEYGEFACNGRARRVVYHPLQLPFCYLESVRLIDDQTDHRRDGWYRMVYSTVHNPSVQTTDYTLRAGMVESIRKSFPMGTLNVAVKGAIGTLVPMHHVETFSASVVAAESDSVVVTDLSGFSVRDVIDIIGATNAVRVIVRAIDVLTSSLLFDPVGGSVSPLEIGSVVRTFGAVPRPVELVANYLFGEKMREYRANAVGDEFIPTNRIKREKTDDYEIEFMGGISEGSLTGSPKYDQMLTPYLKAVDVRIV